jgi:hypothetical protein
MLPAVDALLSRYGATRLRDYVDQMTQHASPGFQDHQDFIAEVAGYTGETLGPELGNAISQELRELPQMLTANHHGIDTFAQSIQSNLLFSMRKRSDGTALKTVPVLACGSVPLNNLTYPRGLLVYAGNENSAQDGVCKLPLFPDSFKQKLVSVVEPFTPEMLDRSRARAARLIEDEKLMPALGPVLDTVFDDFADLGQAFPDYSRQATAVNQGLWRRLFRDRSCGGELIYVELEKITSRLLQKDLFDPSTICHQLMFDPRLRAGLIEGLDGQRGCWHSENLLRRCTGSATSGVVDGSGPVLGTMFFWGVDAKSRLIPLCVVEAQNGKSVALRGTEASGQAWEIPFTPEGIARGLHDCRLLPSIFTSYLLVSIARGISCIGGYYQAEYLPNMKKTVIETLYGDSGGTVKPVHKGKSGTDLYLSAMQAVGFKTGNRLLPAGPIEIIASGGFDGQQYEQMGDLTVLQAHIASLHDIITDVAPRGDDFRRAKVEVSRLVNDAVGDKILTISMD